MLLQGPRTYTLVKVIADDGLYGIGEAYGSPGVGVKQQIEAIKPSLIGRDPLEIDVLYTTMGRARLSRRHGVGRRLVDSKCHGSAHALMRAASGYLNEWRCGIWRMVHKILGVSSTVLLGGKFRDRVRLGDHARPREHPRPRLVRRVGAAFHRPSAGFTCHKFGFPYTTPDTDAGRDRSNRVLTVRELRQIEHGLIANCREALGWDHDIMVHCHWEYDVRTAIRLPKHWRRSSRCGLKTQ